MTYDDFFPRGRLAGFLLQLTAPQSIPVASSKLTRADRRREAEILDLVLLILADAGLGLEISEGSSGKPKRLESLRHLTSSNGAMFQIEVGAAGGYDLAAQIADVSLRAQALSFEALAMTLRSIAGLRLDPATKP